MFYFFCRVDKPGVHDLRMTACSAHTEFPDTHGDTLYFVGPAMNDDENMIASVWIIAVKDRADAAAITARPPYEQVGCLKANSFAGLCAQPGRHRA